MIIGLDVGGTHADVVLLGNQGLLREIKIPTDPADLFQTVLTCLQTITKNIDPDEIQRIVLSTTLTTNTIAQKKVPAVGMIVCSGPGIDPASYRTHSNYYSVSGSIDHRGREIKPIDAQEIRTIGATLKQDGIKHVGIVGKFSVRNPRHEIQMAEILKDSFDRIFLGYQASGSLNFARRIATTYLNAAVYPIHRHFFDAVQKSLQEKGLQVPIHILKADGGTMNLKASMDYPGQSILSGPAASVMGSVAFAPVDAQAVSLDIGGTTTDIAVIARRVPLLHPLGIRLGGFRTLIRSLETHSIGIGGDSVIRVKDGALQIGPQREGPAMAYGGPLPTPTDALFVLGKMRDGNGESARQGIESIANRLGINPEQAAERIFEQTCRTILAEADAFIDRINNRPVYTVHEMQAGAKLSPSYLLVLGGPAPYFVDRLRSISRRQVKLIPRWQVANAIGAALARTTCEVSFLADTQLGVAVAPEEDYRQNIDKHYTSADAVKTAFDLLKHKAMQIGAYAADLETEVLEEHEYNMVRGFLTTGQNIRIKVQVKPGLIHEYEEVVERLTTE